MQERRSRRLVAAATAILLVLVGWLGSQHEAEVAHARDHAGRLVHAQGFADHHEAGASAHLHATEEHAHEAGACSLTAAAHTPAPAAPAPAPVVALATHTLDTLAPAAVHAARAGYRLAPKTSPPARG